MKKILFTCLLSVGVTLAFAQIKNPVSWTFDAKKLSADTYEVTLTAQIEGKWHLYSQNTGKGGPIATKVSFKPNPLVTLTGKVKEVGKVEKTYDEIFKTNVLYLSEKVQYVQTVKLKSNIKTNLSATVEYMVCDDSQCLPPTKKSFELKLQ